MLAFLVFCGMMGCMNAPHDPATDPSPKPSPPLRVGERVLFQGDSITDMNRGRSADPNHILGHSYAFLVAAKLGSEYPGQNLTFINRGVSGNKVSDLLARWQVDAIDLKPTVLSILIGINDLCSGVSTSEYERQLDELLAMTRAAMPDVRLVLCEPFALPVGQKVEPWDSFQLKLNERQTIVRILAAKHHAAFVPLQSVFDDACKRANASYWIWDGIHPTYSGQQLIADAWLRTVKSSWLSNSHEAMRSD